MHVWCDEPDIKTENQIDAGIEPLLQTLAQKNWGAPKLVPLYEQYQHIIAEIGQAPGYTKISE